QAVPAAGQLKIEALAVPKRAFVERYWERPDYYLMTQSDFEQRFPNLPYADEDKKHNWKATTTAFEQEVQLEGQDTLFLNFSGWAVGHYRATLELNDEDGNKVESIKHFVIFDSNKQLLPPGTIAWSKSVKDGKHEPGSTYQRLLGSATNEIPYFIEVEQRNGTTRKEWLRPASWQRINHTVQETDRGNFFVYVQALQYNRFFQFREEVQVPWSNKKLDISYQTFRDKLLPGEDESWTLKISGPGKEAVAAELVATMYDASLDAYRPHNWRFQPYPSNYSSGQWSPQDFSAVYGYAVFARNVLPIYRSDRTYQKLNWCNWDSWYGRGMATTLSAPSMYMDTAAEADEVVAFGIKSRKGEAAPTPSGYEPVVANVITENAPPPSGDSKPPVRKNLKETVFFFPQLRTDEEGNVLIKFTMNEALTRWKFMALAHTASLQYALTEQEVVTQKQLMIEPNAPRFMRQGDKLVFTAKVSNLSEGQLTGGAKLQLFDAASMRPLDLEFGNESAKQVFTVEPGLSQVVAWAINVPDDFSGAIAHRVTAEAGNFADGEESALPILTNRTLVTET
ncbi:MAG: alpha-2-macroglobulin, partial [Phaeodactylibacter sp.]|nr:alpha-2-macroglobulin [Phaeodactylibacter sp.]